MSEADIGRRQICDALMVAQKVVVADEARDLLLQIARQMIVFKQNAILRQFRPNGPQIRPSPPTSMQAPRQVARS